VPFARHEINLESGAVAIPASSVAGIATYATRVVAGTIELEILVQRPAQEVIPISAVRRDHPIRWVRRKTDAARASASTELPLGAS
jgi:hypothetical protein